MFSKEKDYRQRNLFCNYEDHILMILMLLRSVIWINSSTHFSTTCLFLYLLQISENQGFSDDFRGYRKRTMAWNRLATNVRTNALQTNWLFFRKKEWAGGRGGRGWKHWLRMGQWMFFPASSFFPNEMTWSVKNTVLTKRIYVSLPFNSFLLELAVRM